MEFKIRNFEANDQEYEAISEVQSSVWPEYPRTVDEFKLNDKNWDKKYIFQRLVIEVDKKIVGFGGYSEPSWSYQPNKYSIGVDIMPAFRSNGIGTAFYEYVIGVLEKKNANNLIASTRENQPQSIAFLEKRGFEFKMRFPISHLDLQTFEYDNYSEALSRTENEGIRLLNLNELKDEYPNWQRKLYELKEELIKDVPSVEPLTSEDFEIYIKRVFENPSLVPECWIIALDGDELIGYSNIWKVLANDEKLDTGLTGVLRSHRRKGVCTGMKVHSMQAARNRGAKILETENEENNPMYQINLRLGFKPQPAWLDYQKIIK
jgi:GNAT superfamily N-acetyltransferase